MSVWRIHVPDDQIEALLVARSVDADRALVDDIMAGTERLPQRRPRWLAMPLDRRMLLLVTAALLLAALAGTIAFAGRLLPDLDLDPHPPDPPGPISMATTAPAPMFWQGGPRSDSASLPVLPTSLDPLTGRQVWMDPDDSTVAWADIIEVNVTDSRAGPPASWHLTLSADAPPTAHLAAKYTVTAYGLVFDTTGDGEADYVLGLSDDGLEPGDYRAWLTDLTTGETEEQIGRPYGRPFDFVHPNDVRGLPEASQQQRRVTFLSIRFPRAEITRLTPFYAWALVTRGGEAVAWDYAPDGGWLQQLPVSDE